MAKGSDEFRRMMEQIQEQGSDQLWDQELRRRRKVASDARQKLKGEKAPGFIVLERASSGPSSTSLNSRGDVTRRILTDIYNATKPSLRSLEESRFNYYAKTDEINDANAARDAFKNEEKPTVVLRLRDISEGGSLSVFNFH